MYVLNSYYFFISLTHNIQQIFCFLKHHLKNYSTDIADSIQKTATDSLGMTILLQGFLSNLCSYHNSFHLINSHFFQCTCPNVPNSSFLVNRFSSAFTGSHTTIFFETPLLTTLI